MGWLQRAATIAANMSKAQTAFAATFAESDIL